MANSKPKYTLGREESFEFSDRYFLQTAERAMGGDIVRGLVELITNSDDSYADIEETSKESVVNGEITVSVERKRKGKNSLVTVLDRAEGMNLEEMVTKLRRVGSITSRYMENKGRRTRGLMGRGSKECVIFGELQFKSIKDGKYSEVHLKPPAKFKPVDFRDATRIDRVALNIPSGNGTLVTLEVQPRFKIPSHEILVKSLPRYYSLRDITSSPQRKLLLVDSGRSKDNTNELSYVPKEGQVVLDEIFIIPGYSKAEAHLVLKKGNAKIKAEPNSPYWEGGILLKSNYAIHGVTGLTRDIENNPHFETYFGILACPFIDDLTFEYEALDEQGFKHSPENPVRIIDPERYGLVGNHPFTKALFSESAHRIKELLKKDEEAAKHKLREIENHKTTERLKKLASEVSKFIRERTEDEDSIDDEFYLDPSEIPAGGILVIPKGAKVSLLAEKEFYVYAKPVSQQSERHVMIQTKSENIAVGTDKLGLLERGDGILSNHFSVKGLKKGEATIKVSWGKIESIVNIQVVERKEAPVEIPEFSFEKNSYAVKEGKQKNIKIFAKWPEFVHGNVEVKITSSLEGLFKIVNPTVRLKYEKLEGGTKAAAGTVKIIGKKSGGPVTLQTSLQNKTITTKVRVIPDQPMGKDITIKVVDEDLGDQRAVWDSNLLKISGQHASIKRYLGAAEDGFPGQDSLHFRLLVAELIADNVARRVLELNAQKDIRAFENMDITAFYRLHRRYMNDFLEVAHKIQIPELELGLKR